MTLLIADIIWPALVVEPRLSSWWAIGSGLLVEFFFVRRLTTLDLKMSAVADLTMNAASALLGILLLPLSGLAWEVFPGIVLSTAFNIGTFKPGTWTATFLLAVFINAVLEITLLTYSTELFLIK